VEGSEDRCQTSRLKNVERKTGLLTWVARTLTSYLTRIEVIVSYCDVFYIILIVN
jgi:hypothetical protein